MKKEQVTPEKFTAILDTIYNVGDPKLEGYWNSVLPEFKETYEKYYELKAELGSFNKVVEYAKENGLLFVTSAFYTEYKEDLKHR